MTWLHNFWHDYIFSTESLTLGTSIFLCFDRTKPVLYWQFDSTLKKITGSPDGMPPLTRSHAGPYIAIASCFIPAVVI